MTDEKKLPAPIPLIARVRNEINEAAYRLDAVELRIVLAAIAHMPAVTVDPTYVFRVSAQDLVDLGSNKERVYEQMQEAVKRLFNRELTIRQVEAGTTVAEVRMRWIYFMGYDSHSSEVYLSFSPPVLPYLQNLKERFTQVNLAELRSLRSSYAMRLWMAAMQFKSTGTFVISVDEFRRRFGVGTAFPQYGALKRRVILPALAKIAASKYTSCKLILEEVRERRKVVRLIFRITSKDEPAPITLKDAESISKEQINLLADWLAGKNIKLCEQTGFSTSIFMEDLIREGWISNTRFAGCTGNEFRDWLKEQLQTPRFVTANAKWIEKLGFHLKKTKKQKNR